MEQEGLTQRTLPAQGANPNSSSGTTGQQPATTGAPLRGANEPHSALTSLASAGSMQPPMPPPPQPVLTSPRAGQHSMQPPGVQAAGSGPHILGGTPRQAAPPLQPGQGVQGQVGAGGQGRGLGDDLLNSYGLGLDLGFSEQEQAHITQMAQQHGGTMYGHRPLSAQGQPYMTADVHHTAKKLRTDM